MYIPAAGGTSAPYAKPKKKPSAPCTKPEGPGGQRRWSRRGTNGARSRFPLPSRKPRPSKGSERWGGDYGATEHYLRVFISRLRGKIERPGGPRYIQTERGRGYRFVRPAEQAPSREQQGAGT